MKALCITGADNSTLEAIAAPFYKAGMQPPKPLKREKEVSFARWHQQVGDTLAKKQPIGKLWENLASDLLLVNLESELWGWYEEQSVKALDFWADLEPSIHFLLVCTRPEDELCQKISQTEGSVDAEAFIKEWHQRHKKLLQFYLKHPQRCLLIDAQDALQHLNKQLLLAHDHWQLPLDQETAEQQVETPAESAQAQENAQEQTSGIVSLVAREALKKVSIDITDFYTELRAAQYPLNGLEESEATTRKLFDWLKEDIDLTALNQLLTEYRALQQQATLASKLPMLENQSQNIRQQLEEGKQENKLLLLQLHQVQEELESYFVQNQNLNKKQEELQTALQEAAKQKENAIHQSHLNAEAKKAAELKIEKSRQQLEKAEEENKLQLMQLQQVKEELQFYFQKNQTLQAELEDTAKQKEDALHQNHLNFVAKEDALHQNHLNVEAKKAAELKVEEIRHQLDEGKQENELLLLQLHQVQEELESYFVHNQNLNKKQEELQTALQEAAKQKENALHQNHLNFVAKNDAEQKVKETTQQLEESKQENELLLLQLHQVQEELESHFLQNQELSKKQEELNTALEDALHQNHLNAVAKQDALHQNHLNAEAKKAAQEQVVAITQEYESLLKELHQTQVNLEKSIQENHQLSRMVKQLQAANEQYKQSWAGRLVKAPAPEKELVYQDLELTHEQVNSDYEHLLINLKNPAFGAATASQWSFCLSCAAVKPGAFGQQPKLELPEQKEQLLHKWFEESVSEHGPKLELRFALPGSMDTSVWKQIEQHDQTLIRSLIEQLPQILGELKQKGTPISRSWEDWERLASDMNRIHQSKVSK